MCVHVRVRVCACVRVRVRVRVRKRERESERELMNVAICWVHRLTNFYFLSSIPT